MGSRFRRPVGLPIFGCLGESSMQSSSTDESPVVAPEPTPKGVQVPVQVDALGVRPHLAHVDGLRAIAALYVVCVHVLPRAWLPGAPHSKWLRLVAKVTSEGHFAVTAFLVISGFCLMLPVLRSELRLKGGSTVFFKRRFLRIAPPLYAAFVLSVGVLQLSRVRLAYGYPQVTLRQVVAHAFLIQMPTPDGLLANNGVLWSISMECFAYLSFPLYLKLSRRFGPLLPTVGYMLGGYVAILPFTGTVLGALPWQYLGVFALGALAAYLSYAPDRPTTAIRHRVPWYSLAAICVVGVVLYCVGRGWAVAERHVAMLDLPMSVAAAAILVGAARPGRSRLRSCLGLRPLAAVGLFSYSLYMIHFPLADALCQYLLRPMRLAEMQTEAMLAGVVIPLILLAAYGFYWAFERPFHQLARRVGR
jgi:peptidoglycan/LPS O-acetylase OafA/YrhL